MKNGKIAVITADRITGTETIAAKGLVLAPGFIDTHVHGMARYGLKLALSDGVATALELEIGVYPVEAFDNRFKGKTQRHYGASVSRVFVRMAEFDKVNPKGLGLYGTALKDSLVDKADWSRARIHCRQPSFPT